MKVQTKNKNSGHGYVLAIVKDLQEEIDELIKSFLNVDEKNVQCVLKQQVKLEKKTASHNIPNFSFLTSYILFL